MTRKELWRVYERRSARQVFFARPAAEEGFLKPNEAAARVGGDRWNFAVDPQRACTHAYGMFVPVVLLLVVVAYRVVLGMVGSADHQWLHNFSPLAAVALCGAVYLPRRYAFVLPLGILFASDLILNLVHYQRPFLALEIVPRYLALALIIAMGLGLRRWRRPVGLPSLLAASFAGSVAFYLISNTGSWIAEPAYAKTVNGWLQALTTGLPGYPPTWWFYRHTMVSDLLFTLIFAGCVALAQQGAAVTPVTRVARQSGCSGGL